MKFIDSEALLTCASDFCLAAVGNRERSESALTELYRASMSSVFGKQLPASGLSIEFEDSANTKEFILSHDIQVVIETISNTGKIERQEIEKNIIQAIMQLKNKFPDLRKIIDLQIAMLLITRNSKSGSGTSSHTPCQLWLSPALSWNEFEYMECIFHELVHLNLFLLDSTYGLYEDRSVINKTLVYSTLKGKKRPFDKSFHALCVSSALITFYRRIGIDEEANKTQQEVIDCKKHFLPFQDCFSDLGTEIYRAL